MAKKLSGNCPKCKKETLETYTAIISVKGMKYDCIAIRCTNCKYTTEEKGWKK